MATLETPPIPVYGKDTFTQLKRLSEISKANDDKLNADMDRVYINRGMSKDVELARGSWTYLTFDTQEGDSTPGVSYSGNTFSISRPGLYLISATAAFRSSKDISSRRIARIVSTNPRKTLLEAETSPVVGTSSHSRNVISLVLPLVVTSEEIDLGLQVYQRSEDANVENTLKTFATNCRFIIARIGN